MTPQEIRDRLDRLAASPSRSPTLLDRASRAVGPRGRDLLRALDLSALEALDRELDTAGVHTLADARLLARLGPRRTSTNVAKGMSRRLRRASGRFLKAIAAAERIKRAEG